MGLVLQKTRVQVKCYSYEDLTKKQVKKELFTKVRQKSRQNSFYQDLMLKLDRSSTKAESVEIYEIKNSRSDFWPYLTCICRVSFLTTLDIYKVYFKGYYTWRTRAKSGLVFYSLSARSHCVFVP